MSAPPVLAPAHDAAAAACDRLVGGLALDVDRAPLPDLLEVVTRQAAARARDPDWGPALVPSDIRLAGSWAVRAHLEREALRAVVRRRYRAHDEGLRLVESLGTVDPGAWRTVSDTVFTGRPVDAGWCARLLAEVEAHDAWCAAEGLPAVAPNSMNRYGLILVDLGLGPVLDRLVAEVAGPPSARRFAELGGDSLDGHHGFIVRYDPDGDTELAFHMDDAEVTLNLCLGGDFAGGDLVLRGQRCPRHAQQAPRGDESLVHAHEPGLAVLHAGCHRHEVLPLTGGRRVNLILWCRSATWRSTPGARTACGPWCGGWEGR